MSRLIKKCCVRCETEMNVHTEFKRDIAVMLLQIVSLSIIKERPRQNALVKLVIVMVSSQFIFCKF